MYVNGESAEKGGQFPLRLVNDTQQQDQIQQKTRVRLQVASFSPEHVLA